MKSRFVPQQNVGVTIWFSKYEIDNNNYEGIRINNNEINKIPYLEVHNFDHYETKEIPKIITTKETETYYVT